MSSLSATPNMPRVIFESAFAFYDTSIKVATPDVILTDEESLPTEVVAKLLFEQIGGIEIINIARNDIINGQTISYNLIGNISTIQRLYNPSNIFKLVGSSKEFFDNFGIRFATHVPENGTAPAPAYIDVANAVPNVSVPVLDRITGNTITTLTTYADAVSYINNNYPIRELVYVDYSGNLVVDVTGMETNERVDIEVLTSGSLQDDTIY